MRPDFHQAASAVPKRKLWVGYPRSQVSNTARAGGSPAQRKALREYGKHNPMAVGSALIGSAVEPVRIRHQVAEGVQTIRSAGEGVKQRIGPSAPCSWHKLIDRAGAVLAIAVCGGV